MELIAHFQCPAVIKEREDVWSMEAACFSRNKEVVPWIIKFFKRIGNENRVGTIYLLQMYVFLLHAIFKTGTVSMVHMFMNKFFGRHVERPNSMLWKKVSNWDNVMDFAENAVKSNTSSMVRAVCECFAISDMGFLLQFAIDEGCADWASASYIIDHSSERVTQEQLFSFIERGVVQVVAHLLVKEDSYYRQLLAMHAGAAFAAAADKRQRLMLLFLRDGAHLAGAWRVWPAVLATVESADAYWLFLDWLMENHFSVQEPSFGYDCRLAFIDANIQNMRLLKWYAVKHRGTLTSSLAAAAARVFHSDRTALVFLIKHKCPYDKAECLALARQSGASAKEMAYIDLHM
jgi:hypothetical protein